MQAEKVEKIKSEGRTAIKTIIVGWFIAKAMFVYGTITNNFTVMIYSLLMIILALFHTLTVYFYFSKKLDVVKENANEKD